MGKTLALDLCLSDAAGTNAGSADANPYMAAVHNRPDALQVDVPAALGDVVRVTDLVAESRTLAAHFTNPCHKPVLQSKKTV